MEALYGAAWKALELGTARRIFDECLDVLGRLHGGIDDHADFVVTLLGLAGALMGANEDGEARSVFRDSLSMLDKLMWNRTASKFSNYVEYLVFAFDNYDFYRNCISDCSRTYLTI